MGANSQVRCSQVPTRSSSRSTASLLSEKKPILNDSPLSILQNRRRKFFSSSSEDLMRMALSCGFSRRARRQLVQRASEYSSSSASPPCWSTTDWLLKRLPLRSLPKSSMTATSSSLYAVQLGGVPRTVSISARFCLVMAGLVVRITSFTKSWQATVGWLRLSLDAMGTKSLRMGRGQRYRTTGTKPIITCFQFSLERRPFARSTMPSFACSDAPTPWISIFLRTEMQQQRGGEGWVGGGMIRAKRDDQYCISKLRHLISECILKHLSWQMRSPQRGQLERERLPQMEQYLRDGQRGRPTLMLQKLGSVFSSRPSSWMILRRLRFRLRCPSFFARLFTRFSFLCFRGSPSPTSNPSSSSSSAILLGSSKKSSSRQRSFSSITARRLFSSTFRTAAEKRLFLPPWRVLGMALDIIYTIYIITSAYQSMPTQLYLLLVLLAATAAAKMVIQSPPELSAFFAGKYGDAGIPFAIANYGSVPYGKVISGEMGTPEFLEDCLYEEIPKKARRSVLLVERNDCTFTQKSINVQKEGGKLAVIIDNVVEDSEAIVMKDDGKGHAVTIPTVLVGRQDGLKMLEYIAQSPIIMVSFELKVAKRSDVTLWLDVLDHKNYIFLRSFQPYFNRIASDINFSVAYPTSRCSDNCNQNSCFYEGKYCRYTVGFNSVENAGKEVIREQLRQYSLFKQNPSKWWEYMLAFDDACYDLATFNDCSSRVLDSLGLKHADISASVDQTFAEEDNAVLRTFSELKYNNSILYYPSVVINSIIYRGNLEPYEVFETICESMNPAPAGCSDDGSLQSTHLTAWIIFGVVSVVVFVIFLIVCFRRIARRQLSTEMNKKVNELVNEYISMYEVEKFKQGEAELKNRS